MQYAQHHDFILVDFIEESVLVEQQFTDMRVCEFGHYASALG